MSVKEAYVAEAGSHDDSFVPVLFIIIVDLLDGLNARIVVPLIIFSSVLLVPIEDLLPEDRITIFRKGISEQTHSANEGRDEGNACLGACDGLAETKEESEVTVNTVFFFEFAGGLDALPRRGDLDQDTLLLHADGFVQCDELFRLAREGLES